jgi:hypothetical protein
VARGWPLFVNWRPFQPLSSYELHVCGFGSWLFRYRILQARPAGRREYSCRLRKNQPPLAPLLRFLPELKNRLRAKQLRYVFKSALLPLLPSGVESYRRDTWLASILPLFQASVDESTASAMNWCSATSRHSRRTAPGKDEAPGGELDDVSIVADRIGTPPQHQRLAEIKHAKPLISERVDIAGRD